MNTTRGSTTITCFRCNEAGHIAFARPYNNEAASFVSSVSRQMDFDESARIESPNKRRKLNDENNFGVVDNQYLLIQNDVALTSSNNEGQRNEEWFLDSAASSKRLQGAIQCVSWRRSVHSCHWGRKTEDENG